MTKLLDRIRACIESVRQERRLVDEIDREILARRPRPPDDRIRVLRGNGRIMTVAEKAKRYENALVYVTWACNLNCPRCYLAGCKTAGREPLRWKQYCRIIDRLCEAGYRLGTLHITGGEPTLWPHLVRAIDYTKDTGIARRVRVVSNGLDRSARDYGRADIVTITNYGALNRLDIAHLKSQLGRRLQVRWSVHYPWPYPHMASPEDALPSYCGCIHMSFAGDYVYPCAMAAAMDTDDKLSLDQNFYEQLVNRHPQMQDICRRCINNVRIKPREVRHVTLEIGLWHSRRGAIWSSKRAWL